MIDKKNLDDGNADHLFRETMAGYKVDPDPGIWKSLSRKLLWRELLHLNFTNISRKAWLAGAAGIILTGTAIYFAVNPASEPVEKVMSTGTYPAALPRSTSPGTASAVVRTIATPAGKPSEGERPARTSAVTADQAQHLNAAPVAKKAVGSVATRNLTYGNPTTEKAYHHPEIQAGSPEPDLMTASANTNRDVSGITPLTPGKASLMGGYIASDTIIRIMTYQGIHHVKDDHRPAALFFSASAGLTSELAFYGDPERYTMSDIWLNGGFTGHLSRFSLTTGVAFGYVFDRGNYRAEYKSNDSIGYFNQVVHYSVGQNNEIILNTQNVTVYDSLMHTGGITTTDRYSYLQIPLLLGYRFFQGKTSSLALRAGPAVSLLLGTHRSDPEFNYRNARMIRIDDETPARVPANWQIWADLWFEMRLNPQASLYISPSFKYFLNPMVEKENASYQSPWTIGLGLGLEFNFGNKK